MKKLGVLLTALLITVVSVAAPNAAFAASNAIGVNPRRDYVIQPGDKINDTLSVTNLNKQDDLTIKIQVIDFGAQNETGAPALMLNAKQPTKWSLKPYLTISGQYTIGAGKSVDVPFSIAIPKNLGAGSYYSAIRYSAVNPQTGENLNLTSSAATLIFVRVPGQAKSSLTLEQFGAFTPDKNQVDGVFGSFYSATKPKYLSYRLRNNGNVAEQPKGSILIQNMFGKQVKLIQNANPNNNLVLLGQTRRIDVCINEDRKQVKDPTTNSTVDKVTCNNPNLLPGRYTVKLDLLYGDSNDGNSTQEIRTTATFWYLPVWFIIAVVAAIAIIAGIIYWIIRKIKNRGSNKYRGR